MRYYYKDSKGNLFNFKSEHFVKYKEVTETVTLKDEEGNAFLDENGNPISEVIINTVRDGLQEGYTQITEKEFNELRKPPEPTEEQKAKMEKQRKIAELKRKLSATDYIVLKIAEAQSEGDTSTVAQLRDIYKEQLKERKRVRALLN